MRKPYPAGLLLLLLFQALCASAQAPATSRPRGAAHNLGAASPALQSYPGAKGCLLLDFDGQVVTSPFWTAQNNGKPINAAPSGYGEADITDVWKAVSEDFLPFSLNVTTDEAVYNTYPLNLRQRCIITPTKAVSPEAGGTALLGSFRNKFTDTDDTPCWAFTNSDASSITNAISHEVGHTFGLHHDGITTPYQEYYSKGAVWGTIMGSSSLSLSQWSKGEYPLPTNTEDDVAIIADAVGYRPDDHSNALAGATPLTASGTTWTGKGVIGQRSDQDYFSFTTGGGPTSLRVTTGLKEANLDLAATLFDGSGRLVGSYTTPGPGKLDVAATVSLPAGTYYLQVDGVGSGGSPATVDEYSDYGSLGAYSVLVAKASLGGPLAAQPLVSAYGGNCSTAGEVALPLGEYTLADLRALGLQDNDLSTLKINLDGYEVVLYDGDSFTGDSYTVRSFGSLTCLTDTWNNRTTSLKVQVSTFIATSVYANCAGGPTEITTIDLPLGKYTLADLQARATPPYGGQVTTLGNNFCGLRTIKDREVMLYSGPAFNGDSVLLVGNYTTQKPDVSWANKFGSLKVRVRGATVVGPSSYARVYRDCGYSGALLNLPVGNYTTADLQARGFADNDVSSLKVSTGYELVLYDGDNFSGASLTLQSDTACLSTRLGTGDWNDKTSSLRVRATGPLAGPVAPSRATLYQVGGFGGTTVSLPVGDYPQAALQALGMPAQDLSALLVSAGYEVVLYEADNFTGASLTVDGNSSYLDSFGWNDRAVSLRVRAASAVLTSLTIAPASLTVSVGSARQFTAQAKDQAGNAFTATSAAPVWTVSGGGSISNAGLFTAGPAGGPFTVAATAGGLTATATVTIVKPVLTSITVTSAAGNTLDTGKGVQFTAQAKDQTGAPLASLPVWTVSGGGTNSNAGYFRAGAAAGGPFTIKATVGTVSGTAALTLLKNQTTKLELFTYSATSLAPGDSARFEVYALDKDGNGFSPAATFTVSGGGTISSTGLFRATTVGGPFTVTAAFDGLTDTKSVTVVPPAGATLAVAPAPASVPTGGTQQFSAQARDKQGNPLAATPTWSVSGGGTISGTGLFTAGAAAGGPFTVTATVGSLTGTATFSVGAPSNTNTNLALNKPARASSIENATWAAKNAVDGKSTGTRWSSSRTGTTAQNNAQWLRVDLGATYNINRVRIIWENAYGKDYNVEISTDTVNWTPIKVVTGNSALTNDWTGLAGTGRYVRMSGKLRGTGYGYSIYELEVYGSAAGAGGAATARTAATALSTVAADAAASLAVFPNPTTGTLTLPNLQRLPTTIAVYNLTGELVKEVRLEQPTPATVLDVSALPAGLYLLQITGQGKVQAQRFVKQ